MTTTLPLLTQQRTCQKCSLCSQTTIYRGQTLHLPRNVGMSSVWWDRSLPPSPSTPAVFVIGQNPGWNEDLKNEPFIGASGALVRNVLLPGAHLHELATVYIGNAVRCFTVGNNAPTNASVRACSDYLLHDIDAIHSSASSLSVLCLGAVAVSGTLVHMEQSRLESQKEAFKLNGSTLRTTTGHDVRFYATYHPAFILRKKHMIMVVIDHIQMLSSQLQGTSPVVTEPDFIEPCSPQSYPRAAL